MSLTERSLVNWMIKNKKHFREKLILDINLS